jgi:hypothetical protein
MENEDQGIYARYYRFQKDVLKPWLDGFWYLQVPALTAALSLIFFAYIDQTLEVYRAFTLNLIAAIQSNLSPNILDDDLGVAIQNIIISFGSIFVLSLSILYSSCRLLTERDSSDIPSINTHSPSSPSLQPDSQTQSRAKGYSRYVPSTRTHSRSSSSPQPNFRGRFRAFISKALRYLINFRKIEFLKDIIQYITGSKPRDPNSAPLTVNVTTLLERLSCIFGYSPLVALALGLLQVTVQVAVTEFGYQWWISWVSFILCLVLFFLRLFPLILLFLISLASVFLLLLMSSFPKSTTVNLATFCFLWIGIISIAILTHLCFYLFQKAFDGSLDTPLSKDRDLSEGESEDEDLPTLSYNLIDSFVIESTGIASLLAFSWVFYPMIENDFIRIIAYALLILFCELINIEKIFGINRWRVLYAVPFLRWRVLYAIPFLLTIFNSIRPPQTFSHLVNPVGVVALFLILFVFSVSFVFYFGRNKKIPIFIILIIMAVVFNLFESNDNHYLREVAKNSARNRPIPELNESFVDWLTSRNDDIQAFSKNHQSNYPVYIISAQGGGIFAANQAALTLSRLQDYCPAFAHHIFAISGVSGGSLGAAVFSSLVKALPPKKFLEEQSCLKEVENHTLEEKASHFLNNDFLSPLLAAGLFSDSIQRFLPISLGGGLDRARGLEHAFEYRWNSESADSTSSNPFEGSYYDHWSPTATENAAPALVLNTTVVETGERLLLSPFTFKTQDSLNSKLPSLKDISSVACTVDKDAHIDFPLSTATVLSARFPIVTPVGWFKECRDKNDSSNNKLHLADGGYFENSGFSTAFNIGQRLKDSDKKTFYSLEDKIKFVYLAFTDSPLEQKSGILYELTAFFNSKEARGRNVIEQAEYQIDGGNNQSKKMSDHSFRQFYLTHVPKFSAETKNNETKACDTSINPDKNPQETCQDIRPDFKLPLGWYLSTFSQGYIKDRVGNPKLCQPLNTYPPNNNHCVMESIVDELSLPLAATPAVTPALTSR